MWFLRFRGGAMGSSKCCMCAPPPLSPGPASSLPASEATRPARPQSVAEVFWFHLLLLVWGKDKSRNGQVDS